MFPSTASRVEMNTAERINEEIRRQTELNINRYATRSPDEINARLQELDEEWDTERYLETMAPTFSLIGIGLGLSLNKKWLALPILVQSFFLMHALQGWCPPLPMLRRLGVRTMTEIDYERNALKAIRGDYKDVPRSGHHGAAPRRAFRAATR
jgi:hypothetical protein